MSNIDEQLTEIICKVLLLEPEQVTDSIRRKEYDPWDSMAHLVLITEVENELGIFFDDEEVAEIWTVGDLRKVVASKIS